MVSYTISELIVNPKQFKEMRLNELTNKLYLSEQEHAVQQELVKDMASREERMLSQVKICENAITALEKDPTREAREKRKAEEIVLKDWQDKLIKQQTEIKATRLAIEAIEQNLLDLGIYLKNAKNL